MHKDYSLFPYFRTAKTDVKVKGMTWQWCGTPPLSVHTLKGLFHRDGEKKEMKGMSFFFLLGVRSYVLAATGDNSRGRGWLAEGGKKELWDKTKLTYREWAKKSKEGGQQSRKKEIGERIKAEGKTPNSSRVVAKIKRKENIRWTNIEEKATR